MTRYQVVATARNTATIVGRVTQISTSGTAQVQVTIVGKVEKV